MLLKLQCTHVLSVDPYNLDCSDILFATFVIILKISIFTAVLECIYM